MGGQGAVTEEHRLDVLPAGPRDLRHGADPLPRRPPRLGPAGHVREHGKLRRPDVVDPRPERHIVAEHLHELERFTRTDRREERDPVDLRPRRLVQAQQIRQAQRDPAGPEHVLHGLPEPEVRRERDGSDELRQTNAARGLHGNDESSRAGTATLASGSGPGVSESPVAPAQDPP